MANRPKNPRQTKPVYAIVVEGQTEAWYFDMLKQYEKDKITVNIEPKIQRKQNLDEQYKRVNDLVDAGYDKIFWIVDMDVIVEQKAQLNLFLKYKTKCAANVVVVMNHPCLEYWLLCHFGNCNAPFRRCGEAGNRLKEYLADYEKTEKFYKKQGNDIYRRLKDKQQHAISRSRNHPAFDKSSPFQGLTEMHKLFDELFPPEENK